MKLLSALYFLSISIHLSECYKILGLFPYPGKSHLDVIKPLMKELSRRGHEVVVVSQYPLEEPMQRYTDLSLKGSFPQFLEVYPMNNFNPIVSRILYQYLNVFFSGKLSDEYCEAALGSKVIKNLLESNQTFDLVFHEPFLSDCLLALNEKFKAPIMAITTSVMLPWNNERFGNPDNPSYIPTLWMHYSDRIPFLERVENFLVAYGHILWFRMKQKHQDQIVRKHLGEDHPPLSKYGNNMSLILVNTHFSLNLARPLVPNVVEVGGLHITNAKPLPKNIEKFINESTHGVIYFSLGSMIKGHTFPQEKREAFLKAFARLPQRVLWKWENETMPGKPDNVMIQKWMPQFDILSHPNVKAFISHGGLLGTTEAVHCGVPMVVMPQYGDQHTNAKAVEANGGGVVLYLKEATEETVYQSLKTILEPEFRAKAKALSERFRDRPMSPMDTAIYWVEYVARHKGAPHMKTAAVDMPLYQYLLLDVLAFLAAIILLFSYISYKILSLVFRSVFAKKKVKQN
ncbi:UDP-glycosyltransferase UGT5-like isoform X3 [Coccinella septempunctata]|uniref:UDP-glycosyltransferase UGT5-like isoform X3 n=1 Tax=Coccinella septempunctata TaxID=41139 RepID=UPI001D0955F8|nr:UDP-glycosyltransferase UGT5-like isoform X3 [Coccinella septempunctata]